MNKKLIIIVGIFFVVALVVWLVVWGQSSKQADTMVSPTPTPVVVRRQLEVKSVFPSPGSVPLGETNNAVAIAIDRPIDQTTAIVAIKPSIDVVLSVRADNPNRLLIQPKSTWASGTTYVVSLTRLISQDNLYELQPLSLEYKITPVPPPAFDSEN